MQEDQADAVGGASEGQRSITAHAPWEMFPIDRDSNLDAENAPCKLDAEVHARLVHAVEACLANERYNLFVMAPEPDESFPTADGGSAADSAFDCNLLTQLLPSGALTARDPISHPASKINSKLAFVTSPSQSLLLHLMNNKRICSA